MYGSSYMFRHYIAIFRELPYIMLYKELHIWGVYKKFGEWYQKANKTRYK
jgi:hypothetical protein